MSLYTPDKWLLLRMTSPRGQTAIKVLGSFYGGFAQGDSWKLSSGTTRIEDKDGVPHLHQYSGSVYALAGQEGTSMYTESVLRGWEENLAEGRIERISLDDARRELLNN